MITWILVAGLMDSSRLGSFMNPQGNTQSDEDEKREREAKKKELEAKLHRYEEEKIVRETDANKYFKQVEELKVQLRMLQKQYTQLGFDMKDAQAAIDKSLEKERFEREEINVLKRRIRDTEDQIRSLE